MKSTRYASPFFTHLAAFVALMPVISIGAPNVFLKISPSSDSNSSEHMFQGSASVELGDLRKLFEKMKWVAAPRNEQDVAIDIVFGPLQGAMQAGQITTTWASGGWGRYWTVKKPNILNIYSEDPNKNRAAKPAHVYVIDLKEKTAAIAGTDADKEHVLKYVGPSK